MLTRRILLACLPAALLRAADPWKTKPHGDWTPEEAQRVMRRSPWAKEFPLAFEGGMMRPGGGGPPGGGGMGGPPGGGGGGMGGPGGGGMGGPPGGGMGGPGGGMPEFKALVRWESALPVLQARKAQPPREVEEFYIASVSGMPMMGGGRRAGGPGGTEDPGAAAERREKMTAAMKESARLVTKASGKEGIAVSRLEELRNGGASMLILYFPRAGNEIAATDKEFTLQMKMGPLALKARFSPKEMVYDGKLAI